MISKVNPGKLREKISFYKNEKTIDKQGFKTSSLQNFLNTKCSLDDFYYSESKRSTNKNFDSSYDAVTCTVRYDSRIDSKCIVEVMGKKYKIKNLKLLSGKRFIKLVLQDV